MKANYWLCENHRIPGWRLPSTVGIFLPSGGIRDQILQQSLIFGRHQLLICIFVFFIGCLRPHTPEGIQPGFLALRSKSLHASGCASDNRCVKSQRFRRLDYLSVIGRGVLPKLNAARTPIIFRLWIFGTQREYRENAQEENQEKRHDGSAFWKKNNGVHFDIKSEQGAPDRGARGFVKAEKFHELNVHFRPSLARQRLKVDFHAHYIGRLGVRGSKHAPDAGECPLRLRRNAPTFKFVRRRVPRPLARHE